jgi:hypothetical protein
LALKLQHIGFDLIQPQPLAELPIDVSSSNLVDDANSPPLNFFDNGRFSRAGRPGNYLPIGLTHSIRLQGSRFWVQRLKGFRRQLFTNGKPER